MLRTALDRYQCRARLSGVDQPKPVERIGIPGYGGWVHAYTFSIHEGEQRGRTDPAGTSASGRMHRADDGTEIALMIDHGRWDIVVEIGCIGFALLLVLIAALFMLSRPDVSTGLLLAGLYGIGWGTVFALLYWRTADRNRDRDSETTTLVQLICSTLDAEIVETSHQIAGVEAKSTHVEA